MVEVQKHHEQVQPKVEKQKTPSEVKTGIEHKSKKIAETPIGKKVGEAIKSKTGAYKAGEQLKGILHSNEKKEGNENISEKKSRKEILKNLDGKIEKTLPEGQDIDKIAKILKKPDGTEFKNIDEAKDFLREQFLKGEINNLETPLLDKEGNILKDKEGNEITKYKQILEENPILGELEKNNPKLSKELLAIYGNNIIDTYSDVLNSLNKEGKLPKDLEEFNVMLEEYAIENSGNSDNLLKTQETFEKSINELVSSNRLSSEEGQRRLSRFKGISNNEARNVQAQKLPSNFEFLSGENKSLELIKHFEGFVEKPYWDYKQWTHGYGTKAKGPGDTITKEEATKELKVKVNSEFNLNNYLSKDIMNKLGDNQKASLTSFIFNLGPGKLNNFKSLLRNYPNTAEKIANKMERYNKAGGKILKGLVSRRKTEAKLFLTKDIDVKSNKEGKVA